MGAVSELSEALSILCNGEVPEHERRESLEKTWWYLDWFHRSNITVELQVLLHLSGPGQRGVQNQEVLNEIEKYRTPVALPVNEGEDR